MQNVPTDQRPDQHIGSHHTSTDKHIRKMLAHRYIGIFDYAPWRPTKKAGRFAKLKVCREIRRREKQQWKKELLTEIAR